MPPEIRSHPMPTAAFGGVDDCREQMPPVVCRGIVGFAFVRRDSAITEQARMALAAPSVHLCPNQQQPPAATDMPPLVWTSLGRAYIKYAPTPCCERQNIPHSTLHTPHCTLHCSSPRGRSGRGLCKEKRRKSGHDTRKKSTKPSRARK